MKLDDNGAAFFVEGLEEGETEDPILATSPLPTLPQEPPQWTEAEREAVNRSLNFDDPEEADKSEDMVDQASAHQHVVDQAVAAADILPKNKNNKNKRKRKTKKHARSGSRSSLKEIVVTTTASPEEGSLEASTPKAEKCPPFPAIEVASLKSPEVSEPSLLLSRLPVPESLDSFVVDEDDPRAATEAKEDQLLKKGNGGSLPIGEYNTIKDLSARGTCPKVNW